MTLAGGGSSGSTRSMTGANSSQRFKLSLSFLNRKKKRKNLLERAEEGVRVPTGSGRKNSNIDLGETGGGLGDILQDIAEENEEQLHENAIVLDQLITGRYHQHHHAGGEEEKFTRALVPKIALPFDLQQNDSSLPRTHMTYKGFDIPYPPGGSPPSRRKTERSSSMKALDASTRSGSFRTESTSTQMSTGGHSRGGRSWLSTGCGFRSCSKQIDMETKLRSKDRAAHGEKQRSQRSRSKSADATAWETDTVSDWSVLAAVEKDQRARKRAPATTALTKKKGHKKSSRLAPSPGISPSDAALGTSDSKISMREAYVEVREAAKYDLPSQRSDQRRGTSEVGSKGGGQNMSVSSSEDDNTGGEERAHRRHHHPWERSITSPSTDEEIFTTSFELDGKNRKKWSSNSSDEVEGRHRRAATVGGGNVGSHGRSKSSRSNHSVKGDTGLGVHEEEEDDDELDDENQKSGKKGSRIIFLSTPPRPEDLGMDEDEPSTNDQILLKSTSDRFGEHSKLEPGTQLPRFERTLSVGYNKSNPHQTSSFANEPDMEANAKAWSKFDVVRSNINNKAAEDSTISDLSVREVSVVSKSKEPGKRRFRHIDVQIEDQLVNLRLESDVSDSSQGKAAAAPAYAGSRSSSKMIASSNGGASKSLDVEKPSTKKKRGFHGRRRRMRKTRAPPPLPNDLHGKVKESVAVVKSSYDPYRDFRDSMVEMIVEKEIQGATDLEELLRCYLSLNAAEYHAVIVKVFADVWRELFADAI